MSLSRSFHPSQQHDRPAIPEHQRWRRSIPTQLLWRSVLGSPAGWSGSGSRGLYIVDPGYERCTDQRGEKRQDHSNNMLRRIPSDKRMFHLPCSLRDVVASNDRLSYRLMGERTQHENEGLNTKVEACHKNCVKLLSQPKIVSAAPPRSTSEFSRSVTGRAIAKSGNGISCMDIDRGINGSVTGDSPSRYLLVGSGGGDCSISLYDLSYFGCDEYLYQHSSTSQYLHKTNAHSQPSMASLTHRPIARSLRKNSSIFEDDINAISGVPSGHRHPVLGVHWYPADVYGSFVSASISGEILVWDAQNFIPVFATYSYVYGGGGVMSGIDKAVSPLQCMDLPRTPEGCPHGQALLAMGLGSGDGMGAIRLCDAFSGGSATHELIGHGTGGVNAIAWDPFHPFRLASGGDDHQIRLWDIRKSGSAACLGVLDRDNLEGNLAKPVPKRPRGNHEATSKLEGRESHGGPVVSIAFTPGGEDLVSAGLDGHLRVWDLRPDSCFVNPAAVTISRGIFASKSAGRNRTDPTVAMGGRMTQTYFTGPYRDRFLLSDKNCSKKKPIQNPLPRVSTSTPTRTQYPKVSLSITQSGSRNTTMLWLAGGTSSSISFSQSRNKNDSLTGSQIACYSLFGKYGKGPGGPPEVVLDGHLDDVTCLTPIVGHWDNLRNSSTASFGEDARSKVVLLSGGKDGMVLSWGSSAVGRNELDEDDCARDERYGNSNSVIAILQRQRERQQVYRSRVVHHLSENEFSRRSRNRKSMTNLQDVDNW
mmetsp:Transcript_3766/g.6973  ORF Transcript_3766/g.6973 Transcript_3766/m.6973 type:complete len:760 (+) Transcript_3766:202-2481(+)